MAQCGKCNRTLPANGNCFYCGNNAGGDDKPIKKGSLLAAWFSKLVRTVLFLAIPGAAIFLIFTEQGNEIVRKIRTSIGGTPGENDSPEVKLLRQQVPKVNELLKDRPGAVKFEQEPRTDGTVQVSVLHQMNDVLTRATFLIDVNAKSVQPLDETAQGWMGQ